MNYEQEIKQCYPHEPTSDIAKRLGLPVHKIYYLARKLDLRKTKEYFQKHKGGRYPEGFQGGVKTQFKKGSTPYNKGRKLSAEVYSKAAPTMFKKGTRPHNWKPDGTIEPRKDSKNRTYLWIKIKDSHWVMYHRYIWTQHNGEIPPSQVLVFKDGNTSNCDLDNLELITKLENMSRNTIQRYPQELQNLMKIKSKLIRKIEKNGTQQTK